MDSDAPLGVRLVEAFLKGQNLEQVGREDEAVRLYEAAVEEAFDSPGPYDRLIVIYANHARHADVIRIAERALAHVVTHADKHAWYERMKQEATRAAERVPRAAPKRIR